ncbi:MAG: type II/IV secretion system protein [Candidatus Pacebacteria bacterium]|jgi:type II secretory ATPase GspE/PulE/Tfp pilus assembly ATPase PilB-like protein|nr:type II/IV secretion system protein [Candidatus Paceibacterota bacterium]MBP9058372.1 type II/IV secretion system protein [Candidatus Paceibacterota bacterium]MBP9770363.1 type II/IV secretion system protein [Candidatus Paceibacterota bacterium]
MSQDFDNELQEKKIEDLKKREEEDLISALASGRYDLPYANLLTEKIENEALALVEEKTARALKVGAYKTLGKKAYLAVHSPNTEGISQVVEDIKQKGFEVIVVMVSMASLEKVWERYKDISHAEEVRAGGIDISPKTLKEMAEQLRTITDVRNVIEQGDGKGGSMATSRILEVIMAGAIKLSASDVHIEAEEESARLRYRLDGVLLDVLYLSKEAYRTLNTRIKLLSGLKLTMKEAAQDGRFGIFFDEIEINIRTSVVPGAYGESIVMRLLDPRSIQVKLEEIGIEPKLYKHIENSMRKLNGLILITGPTGSGKTTTLYAFLQKIYNPELKVITIEDPIEYHLKGITQTQVEKGYSFFEGLRAALRQDPDVIMLGEIRDPETAKTAVESSLTGHLVFSTLHTNNAGGVIPRLIDLEVNPKTLVSSLTISMAQRLVRKLCVNCKKEVVPKEEDMALVRKIVSEATANGKDVGEWKEKINSPFMLYEAPGCPACGGIGYKGRIGIFEAILTDEAIEKIIPENPSERDIKNISNKQGILDMREDGVLKALSGITSLEEVRSVVYLEEEV